MECKNYWCDNIIQYKSDTRTHDIRFSYLFNNTLKGTLNLSCVLYANRPSQKSNTLHNVNNNNVSNQEMDKKLTYYNKILCKFLFTIFKLHISKP